MPTKSENQLKTGVEFKVSRNYWGLVRELAVADFKLKYQGSVFGYLWSLMKPLALFGILYLVFSVLAKFGSNIDHYPQYLLLGVVLWNYFAESTGNGMRAIVDKSDLIRKVYFPRIVIMLASSLSALITLALNLVVVVIFIALAGIAPGFITLAFLGLIAELFLLSLGISFFLGALYVRYRDFVYIWEVVLQLLFYASAVIFPLNMVPAQYHALLLLNPISQILQDSRDILVNPTQTITTSEVIHGPLMLVPYALPVLLAVFGFIYFERVASRFAEDV